MVMKKGFHNDYAAMKDIPICQVSCQLPRSPMGQKVYPESISW